MALTDPVSTYAMRDTLTVNQNESIAYLITEMGRLRFRRFPVVNENNRAVGMVTSSDVLGALHEAQDLSFLKDKVSSIMSDKVIIADKDATIFSCIDLMYNIGISGLPVIHNNEIRGILTEKDLLLIEDLWKNIPDRAITAEEGLGRPITDDNFVTTDFSFWQVADLLFRLPQRQALVKNEDGIYIGQITTTNLLTSLISQITIKGSSEDSLQTLLVSNISLKPLFQRAVPLVISSARLWMNSRGIEAFPIYSRGKPVKLITEKDLVGHLAAHVLKS
ncbi:MAG: CBS domain-containing protein [Candidatus Kariarchaeaceae archaeon]|jgi:CBS domain-containing protein